MIGVQYLFIGRNENVKILCPFCRKLLSYGNNAGNQGNRVNVNLKLNKLFLYIAMKREKSEFQLVKISCHLTLQ